MKGCWRCRRVLQYSSIHHINGNQEDQRLANKIALCVKCHDLVQGICDKCINQVECHHRRFADCWRFEDALPPIYFRPKDKEILMKSIENEIKASQEGRITPCVDCGMPHLRKYDIDLWCPKCLDKLIKKQDPKRWNKIIKWKKDVGILDSMADTVLEEVCSCPAMS